MIAYVWVLIVALGLMSGLAAYYRDQRERLIAWVVEKHPEDLE